MRLSTNDPDDYQQQTGVNQQRNGDQAGVGQYTQLQGSGGGGYASTANKTLGNQRKLMVGAGGEQKVVATISQNYNEKSMLLSSDDECQ